MRKNMNRAIEEFLSGGASSASASTGSSDVVYIGEDVEHGGYYLVTEGLKKKFPSSSSARDTSHFLSNPFAFCQVSRSNFRLSSRRNW